MSSKTFWLHDDWYEEPWPCRTTGFHTYKDSIDLDDNPTEEYEYLDFLEDRCWKNCSIQEAGEHSVSKEFTFESGWSIGGSFGGDTANLWKVFKLSFGVNASYNEKTQVRERITHTFPHGNTPDHFTHHTVSILKVTRSWRGQVTRYYYRPDGRHSPFPLGEVVFQEFGKTKGKPQSTDIPCSEWEEPIPFSGQKTLKVGTIPKSISSLKEYTPNSLRYAMNYVAERIKINDSGRKILSEIFEGNIDMSEILINSYKYPEILTAEDTVIEWLTFHKNELLALDEIQKKIIKEAFKI